MPMISKLFAVSPADIMADPAKFSDIISSHWTTFWCELDLNKPDQKVSDMFMGLLCHCKVLGYLNRDYCMMIEKLFRNLMEQKPEIPKMEWHFICDAGPYCLSIDRGDIHRQCAAKLTQGIMNSAYYYDPPATTEEDKAEHGEFNKERYFAAYPKLMEEPKELVTRAGPRVKTCPRKTIEEP